MKHYNDDFDIRRLPPPRIRSLDPCLITPLGEHICPTDPRSWGLGTAAL